ncbi:TPA_asm: hypothetical protein vir335_00068 [Classicovirus victor]|uniref:Uncharacterized protein n=1 Tax=Caudoviricetes sp. vir335 TaxID=3068357 RepID=A0AA86XKP8_9CAUD|nr:TPA_asm: hypothetical protein vir335_00068 [Caudoviricetes sp. vir335]
MHADIPEEPFAAFHVVADLGIEAMDLTPDPYPRLWYRYTDDRGRILKARIYETAGGRWYIRTPFGRIHLDEAMRA